MVGRWNTKNPIDGVNYLCLTINDTRTCGVSSPPTQGAPEGKPHIGSTSNDASPANALIEGLTVYRRAIWDGSTGIDVGNGDEIAKIYDSDENPGNGITP